MPASRCSLSALRSALNHLYEPKALRSSPLVEMLGVAAQANAVSLLRDALVKAIESMRPGPGTAAVSPLWRNYEILYYRYVQQSSQQELADQLGVSLRHLKRQQRKALEALAQRLGERHGLQIDTDDEPESEAAGEPEQAALAADEMPWLREGASSRAVQLDDVLPGVLQLAGTLAQAHGTRLGAAASEELSPLAVDAVALRQILLSLLSVAVRQAPGGRVTVSARRLAGEVEIDIQAATVRTRQPLEPADEANIAMARKLASACAGSVKIRQTDLFFASLVLPAAEQATLLVVDDNLDAVRLVQRYVRNTRYRVLGAQDADQTFALAREARPQVIVLDVMMPEVDGWELLGRLKHHPLTSRIPIVACTVLAQEELALALGVSAFLRKPFTRQELLAVLDRLTAQAQP